MVDLEAESHANDARGRMPTWTTLTVGFLLVALLGVIDYATGSEISFSVFYLAPVMYVTWHAGLGAGAAVTFVSAAMWGAIDVAAGSNYSVWVIPVWNSATRFGFFIVAAWLLNSLHRANRKVLALAHTDSLTGLPNARSFYNDLDHEIRRQSRYSSVFTLAYIDLDHFKAVNDAHGHAAGDELLRDVGSGIAAALRETDVVARLGGDEFGLLLPETDVDDAAQILTRVQNAVAETMRCAAPGVDGIGATVGAVVFRVPAESSDAAVLAADDAMYEGKRIERGSLQIGVYARDDAQQGQQQNKRVD